MEIKEKKILKAVVLELRHLLEGRYDNDGRWHPGDLEQRLAAIGIRRKHNPVPIDELPHLSNEDKRAREVVDAYLTLRQEAGIQIDEAVREFVRETAYTWANRLLALRCMEARELIDEVILQKEVYGGRSLEHHRLAQRQPELCAGEDDGLFAVFDKVFAVQAKRLPLLFDPKAPGVALRPSPSALNDCIGLLSLNPDILSRYRIKISDNQSNCSNPCPLTPTPYTAPDALGWAYQYWNTEEKDRVFEKVRTQKGAKIEGADIIPATQLYTEPYMVKFLVQNSLGALWMGIHSESRLYEQWEYYVRDADRAPVEKKIVREITFLDPACGSGHFLLEAFDLFYSMYEEEAKRLWGDNQSPFKTPKKICESILCNNLFGIDIDERAVQIAEAALWMKAAEKAFDFEGVQSNLISSNICLPKGKDHLKEFLKKHPEDEQLRPALEIIFEGLEYADQLGAVLQIEKPVKKEFLHLKKTFNSFKHKGVQKNLFVPTTIQGKLPFGVESYEQWEQRSLKALKLHFSTEAKSANLVQVFFSLSVSKGLTLFDILSEHYDIVAANPPYLCTVNMGDNLRKYCQQYFEQSKYDLFSVFIELCTSLLKGSGFAAIVTQETWLTSQQFKKLRKKVLKDFNFRCLAHIGPHGFSEIGGGKVSTALVVIQNLISKPDDHLLAYRLSDINNSELKDSSLKRCIKCQVPSRTFSLKTAKCLEIPQAPVAYWASEGLLDLLSKGKKIEVFINNANFTKTGKNERFIRFFWEVKQDKVSKKQRWIWISKGVKFSRWQGDWNVIIDWSEGARRHYRSDRVARITDKQYWELPGLTYCTNSTLGLAFRMVTRPGVATYNSPLVFSENVSLWFLLAFLNSRYATYVARLIAGPLAVVIGDIKRIPCPTDIMNAQDSIEKLAQIGFECKGELVSNHLDESDFDTKSLINLSPSIKASFNSVMNKRNFYQMLLPCAVSVIEDIIMKSASIVSEKRNILDLLGTPTGWFSLIKDYDSIPIFPKELTVPKQELLNFIESHKRKILSSLELANLRDRLRNIYERGSGVKEKNKENENIAMKANSRDDISCAYIPIPAESFMEEISQKLVIHPISVYWLLKEGIEKEGWRCIPEEQRITADRFTVMVLRLLGHRWPKQIEAGEPIPDWAFRGGIIPLTEGTNELTLLARVRERITVEFEGGDVSSIEREFADIMGKPLDQWLEIEFFKHHTKQFKKRPIAWQIQSSSFTKRRKSAFACLLYYHKVDGDIFPKIRTQYVGPLRQRLETELRGIEAVPLDARSDRQEKRRLELQDLIIELKDFDLKLQKISTEGFACKKLIEIIKKEPLDKWGSIDGIKNPPTNQDDLLLQEQSYIPNINDGVRVNIAPLQKAGLLASDVLAKKDIDKAIEDRAEWRADERRWCREGKLPQPGWWNKR